MRTISLVLFAVPALSLLACSGSVETSGTSSRGVATGAGAGGAATTSTTTATSGAGGSAACAGFIDVTEDNAAPKHYTSICAGSWGSNASTTPVGYLFSGGPAPGVQGLNIVGCAAPGASSPGIHLSASDATSPGTYTQGSTQYTDMNNIGWGVAGDPFKLTVTKLDAVGGFIDGMFSVIVTHGGNAAHTVTGQFHVCRVEDLLAP